jgi:hypothetical protein
MSALAAHICRSARKTTAGMSFCAEEGQSVVQWVMSTQSLHPRSNVYVSESESVRKISGSEVEMVCSGDACVCVHVLSHDGAFP